MGWLRREYQKLGVGGRRREVSIGLVRCLENLPRRFWHGWPVATALLGVLVSGCSTLPKSSVVFDHQKTVIGVFNSDFVGLINNSKTANGCRVAEIVHDGSKVRALVDGVLEAPFEEIKEYGAGFDTFTFSADGRHCAYTAKIGDKFVAVIDGNAGPQFERVDDPGVIFSQNSAHAGYVARDNYKDFTVVDGVEGARFDAILHFTFSPDGAQTAYSILTDGNTIYRVVENGKVGSALPGVVSEMTFSPDGKHFAYVVDIKDNYGKLIVDGVMQAELPDTQVESFQYSPDGKHLAYVAAKGDLGWLVKDGVPGPPYDIQFINFLFSPDGEHAAYLEGGEQLLVDGKKMALVNDFQLGNFVAFAPDGHLAAYIAATKGSQDTDVPYVDAMPYVVTNDIAQPTFDEISELTLSPDGKRVAYRALEWNDRSNRPKSGVRYRIVIDGKLQPKFQGVSNLKFSPDSKHFAYEAYNGTDAHVVLDGKTQTDFPSLGRIVFSSDGQRMAYVAQHEGDEFVMTDGSPGPHFERILVGPVVCADGRLEYLAVEKTESGRSLVRVDVVGFSPPSENGVMPSWSSKFAHEHWGE